MCSHCTLLVIACIFFCFLFRLDAPALLTQLRLIAETRERKEAEAADPNNPKNKKKGKNSARSAKRKNTARGKKGEEEEPAELALSKHMLLSITPMCLVLLLYCFLRFFVCNITLFLSFVVLLLFNRHKILSTY